MSDIYKTNNISKFDKNDPNYLRVNETAISRSLDSKKNLILKYKNQSISSKNLLIAAVFEELEQRSLENSGENISNISAEEKDFYNLLLSLKRSFLTLSRENKSTDITFIKSLSNTWNFLNLSIKRRQTQKHPLPYLFILTETFLKIESYSEDEGESFGYYLAAHKKSDWFPVPYLQMLEKLHLESLENNADSCLKIWIQGIDNVLFALANPPSPS
jgi:hypothetical protein